MTTTDILLRIGLSMMAGLVLGYERESHGRAAGLRTTMLICVAACLAMLISQMVYVGGQSGSDWYARITVTTTLDGISNTALKAEIEALGIAVKKIDLSYDRALSQRTARCDLKFKRADKKHDVSEIAQEAVEQIFQKPGVIRVEWK